MMLLRKFIGNGWLLDRSFVSDQIKKNLTYKDELSVIDDLIYKYVRLVVPQSLRQEMLSRIHYNHLGIKKYKSHACEMFFWLAMSKQIMNVVQNYKVCQQHQKALNKESYCKRNIPQDPWQIIDIDLFYYADSEYLLMVDYFSKCVKISKLYNISSKIVIVYLKSMFTRLGIPYIVYLDNGPQFWNNNFLDFSSTWKFEHRTSSSWYSQSNGLAERFVSIIKQYLKNVNMTEKYIFSIIRI